MKTLLLSLIIILSTATICFAEATEETGDTRCRPITCYGTESDGSITAILVDSDGVIQTT